jgi:hypothetical protein
VRITNTVSVETHTSINAIDAEGARVESIEDGN